MGLAPRLRPGRGYDAASTGRDTLAQLEALRSGEQSALLMLGGCLLGNVLDVVGAREALEQADVVVVTGHGGASLAYADVVLPAAVQHERLGTVTNIEGRVTAVAPKIVAPGSAWPDVAIASELAEEFGQSIGLASVEAGRQDHRRDDGLPGAVGAERLDERRRRRRRHRRAFRASTARPDGLSRHSFDRGRGPGRQRRDDRRWPTSPRMTSTTSATLGDLDGDDKLEVPLADSYSLRVNLEPTSLRQRHRRAGLAVTGHTEGRERAATSTTSTSTDSGVATGDVVGVSGPRGSIRLPVALDDAVPRGVTEIAFGSLDADGNDVVRPILDGGDVISQVRLESA